MDIKKARFGNVLNWDSRDMNIHTKKILDLLGMSYTENDECFRIDKLLPVGCDDPEDTQDDGSCICNECSMGENADECLEFRSENKLELRY